MRLHSFGPFISVEERRNGEQNWTDFMTGRIIFQSSLFHLKIKFIPIWRWILYFTVAIDALRCRCSKLFSWAPLILIIITGIYNRLLQWEYEQSLASNVLVFPINFYGGNMSNIWPVTPHANQYLLSNAVASNLKSMICNMA